MNIFQYILSLFAKKKDPKDEWDEIQKDVNKRNREARERKMIKKYHDNKNEWS